MSSVNFMSTVKAENGCGGTSTFFPFHLTSFILRTFDAQLTLCRTKRVVEVDQAESCKPSSLRRSTFRHNHAFILCSCRSSRHQIYKFPLIPQQGKDHFDQLNSYGTEHLFTSGLLTNPVLRFQFPKIVFLKIATQYHHPHTHKEKIFP